MLLVFIVGEIANITCIAWNACKRYCREIQQDNNIPFVPQDDVVAPLMDEVIAQPDAEMVALGDLPDQKDALN